MDRRGKGARGIGIAAATVLLGALTAGCASPQERRAANGFEEAVAQLEGVVEVEATPERHLLSYGTETPVVMTVEPRGAAEVAELVGEVLEVARAEELAAFGLELRLANSPVFYTVWEPGGTSSATDRTAAPSLEAELELAHDLAANDLAGGFEEVRLRESIAAFTVADAAAVAPLVRDLMGAGHDDTMEYWTFRIADETLSMRVTGALAPRVLTGWDDFVEAVHAHPDVKVQRAEFEAMDRTRWRPRTRWMALELGVTGSDFSPDVHGEQWWPLLDDLAAIGRSHDVHLVLTGVSDDLEVGYQDLVDTRGWEDTAGWGDQFEDTWGWRKLYEQRRDAG